MADTNPTDAPRDPNAVPASIPGLPPPRQRRKKRWLFVKVILVMLVLLVVLAALLPTIASTGPVRNLVLGQANKQFLDGKIEVSDWNFGWLSGQSLSGIKVYDDKRSLVAEIAKVTTDATLIGFAGGKLDLGNARVEGLNANVRRHPDGALNVEHIAKPSTDAPAEAKAKKDKKPTEPVELPNITGDITIVDGRATLSGEPGVPNVEVTGLNGNIKLPGGDGPIQNKLDLVATVGDGAPGKLSIVGTLSAIKDGKLVIDTVDGQQDVAIQGIDLASIAPLLGKDAPITSVKGKTDGTFKAVLKGGKEATVDGKLTIAGLAASGPALKGDTYSSDTVEITLPAIVVAMPNGPTDVDAMHVKTGSGPDQPIAITLQQGKVTAYADASLASVLKAMDGQAPGETGKAVVSATFDVGKLAGQLRNTFKLVDGVELTAGQFTSNSTIDITPDALALVSRTELTGVAGTNAGKPVKLQPITVDLGAKAGGGGNLLASIRDVKLDLASAFANGSFAGPTLTGINGKLNGALDKVQAELGQVVDFGTTKLSGTFAVDVATKGDLANTATTPAELSAGLTVDGLRVEGIKDQPPIEQRQIVGRLVARVLTDESSAPKSIDVTVATLRTGDANAPTILADATANVALAGGAINVPNFAVKQFAVDLSKLGNEIGGIAPQLKNVTGTINAALAGSATNLTDSPQVTLVALSANHSDGLFNVRTPDGTPLVISMPKGAALPHATGRLNVDADLARLNAQMRKLGGTEVAASTATGDVRSGRLTGTLELARPDATSTAVKADFVASEIVLTDAAGKTQQFKPLTLALKAAAPDDLSSATIANASVTGDLLTAGATNMKVVLKDPAKPNESVDPMKMVESADVALSIPNLAPLYTLATAFLPPPAPPKAGEPPAAAMAVTGGSFATKAAVSRGAGGLPMLNVSELRGENIAIAQGQSVYQIASLAGTQTITPNGQTLSPKGTITITGLKLTDNGKPVFSEDQVAIENDLSVDLAKGDAVINAFSMKMVSSQALSLTARGALRDYLVQRRFDNVTADVTYDLAQVWQLAKPFVVTTDDSLLAKLQTSGKVERQWTVNGQFPANLPFNEAIQQVTATGAVAVPIAQLEGSTLEGLEVPIRLANGIATVDSPPAKFNGGSLDIGGTTVDLTDPVAPRLSMPKEKKIVVNAAINPFLATNLLGKFVNPAFTNPSKATGQLNATVLTCDRVPLNADVLMSKGAQNDGGAAFEFEIPDLLLGNELLAYALRATGNAESINGTVRKSRVTLARGVTTSDITIAAVQGEREYPLRFAGSVSLVDQRLTPMNFSLLTEFLKGRGGDLAKYMPAEITLPITGTTTKPELKMDQMIGQLIQGAIQKQLLDNLTGGGKKDDGKKDDAKNGKPDPAKPGTPTAKPEEKDDPLGDLIKGLTKDRDKDKEKKKKKQ